MTDEKKAEHTEVAPKDENKTKEADKSPAEAKAPEAKAPAVSKPTPTPTPKPTPKPAPVATPAASSDSELVPAIVGILLALAGIAAYLHFVRHVF